MKHSIKLRIVITAALLLLASIALADTVITAGVEYGKAGDTPLLMDIIRPAADPGHKMPAVIWIHGGGWCGGDKKDIRPAIITLAELGYTCASINYRLTDEAPFPAQIEDCKCAVRFLRANADKYNIDPNRIGTAGLSAGGHLSALMGTTNGVSELEGKGGWQDTSSSIQAAVDQCGPTDFVIIRALALQMGDITGAEARKRLGQLEALLGGPIEDKEAECKAASPTTYITEDDPPFLIIHGDADPTVPIIQSQLFEKALKAKGVPVELMIVKGGDHSMKTNSEVDEKIVEYFNKVFGVEQTTR